MSKKIIDADALIDWLLEGGQRFYAEFIEKVNQMAKPAINWIPYTVENALDHDLINKKNNFVYLDAHNLITFSRCVLTTHFALKSEYEAMLPKEGK